MFDSKISKIKFILLVLILTNLLSSCNFGLAETHKLGKSDELEKTILGDKKTEEIDEDILRSVKKFTLEGSGLVLKESTIRRENELFSPISLHLGLSVMAEGASQRTRGEILNILNVDKPEDIRKEAGKMYRNIHFDNDSGIAKLDNSIWFKKGQNYKQDKLDEIAKEYYTNTYEIDFSDEEEIENINDWIAEKSQSKDPERYSLERFTRYSSALVLNTVSFQDEWAEAFNPKKTKKGMFTVDEDEKVEVEYMHKTLENSNFGECDKFITSTLHLKNGYEVLFILPKEEGLIEKVVTDERALEKAIYKMHEDPEVGVVEYKIPKIEYSIIRNMTSCCERMGISRAFNSFVAEFDNFTDDPMYISYIAQKVEIKFNEKGIGFDDDSVTSVDRVEKEPDFRLHLDRPFIYTVLGPNEVLLYVGVVGNPLDTGSDLQ